MFDELHDIVSVGDSTTDVFLKIDPADTESVCKLDDQLCLVAFEYGAKVPVQAIHRIPAVGNAANLAIGMSRLGLKTAIYTAIGDDKDSQEIKEVFAQERVDTSFVVMERGKRANFSTVLNYSGERTIFVYHEDRKYKLPQMETNWLYLSSVAKEHQSLHTEVLEFVKKNKTKLGFNPGSYQLRDGFKKLKTLFAVTEVLILNKEEANMLTGENSNTKDLLKALKSAGPNIVVITDGRNGSYATPDGREIWHVGIPDTPMIERTGAGDAYSTALIAALINGCDLPTAMQQGTMNSTSVIQFVGAREGLLSKKGMNEYLEKYKKQITPKLLR